MKISVQNNTAMRETLVILNWPIKVPLQCVYIHRWQFVVKKFVLINQKETKPKRRHLYNKLRKVLMYCNFIVNAWIAWNSWHLLVEKQDCRDVEGVVAPRFSSVWVYVATGVQGSRPEWRHWGNFTPEWSDDLISCTVCVHDNLIWPSHNIHRIPQSFGWEGRGSFPVPGSPFQIVFARATRVEYSRGVWGESGSMTRHSSCILL